MQVIIGKNEVEEDVEDIEIKDTGSWKNQKQRLINRRKKEFEQWKLDNQRKENSK